MTDLFHNKGFVSSGFRNLSPREAYAEAMEGGALIVDVREERLIGYKNFDVPGLIHLPKSRIEQEYVKLSRELPLIIADSVGLRSHEVMEFLISKGFDNIANLAGGIVDWEQEGMPLKIDITEQLSGSCVCQLRPRRKK
ncbi:MAG: rhodanese-like domain-containing protein [Bacteroidales bacterium]|nr:rhodanese-like domain-containing protein [Bacteroidales bacterium]